MGFSSSGFGDHPFGSNPFGESDWSEDLLWYHIPEFYRLEDSINKGDVENPLRGFIDSIKPSFTYIKNKFDDFTSLWNADTIPIAQIDALAYNFGIDSAEGKSDIFRRLEILNAVQFFLNKGTDKGYRIVASFEGLTVEVTPLWAENCDPDPILYESGPTHFIPKFDEISADEISLDSIYTDQYAIWPHRLHPIKVVGSLLFDEIPLDEEILDISNTFQEPRCRSSKLNLRFLKPDDSEIQNYNDVSQRIINFLERVRPIHVEFNQVRFDGPKAVAYWGQEINSGQSAVAYYTAPIDGLTAAVAYWNTSINANII